MFGYHAESERWHECVTYVTEKMGNAVGRLFVQAHFDEGSKTTVSLCDGEFHFEPRVLKL